MIAYPLAAALVWHGKRLRLNTSFDTVLRVYDLQKEPSLSEVEKLDMQLEMLVKDHRAVRAASIQDRAELLRRIFDEIISIKTRPSKDNTKVVDFGQDAPYIYASFKQAYGIDLNKEQGRLDWRFFIALFQGLPESTKIREIMSIRARPLPKRTKYNADEIQALVEAQAYWRLEISEEEAEAAFQAGLDKLVGTLEAWAKKAGGKNG